MRVALLSLLLAAAGCISSSPQTSVRSNSATSLRLDYTDNARQQVAEALQNRGCAQSPGFEFECPLQSADGQSYAVVIAPVDSYVPLPPARRDDGTEVAALERSPIQGNYGSGPFYHRLPRGSQEQSATVLTLQITARGSDGAPVVLAGDAAAALRESLHELLIQDLPVVQAYYAD